MEATWLQLSKQTTTMKMTDESDTDSVTLEESKELFPVLEGDEMDKTKKGASSEVDNCDIM